MNWLLYYSGIIGLSLLNSENVVICDEISLPQGKIQGTYNFIDGYHKYLGIPYASIPARYEEPGDPPTWTGTYKADSETVCKQFSPITKIIMGTEECLTANVFMPANKGTEPLPVIVFVHGGGFFWGSNTNMLYNPKFLVEKNVVVVNINYRVGAFGFLCLRTKGASGNIGLKDQVAALKWVKNNIKFFGGDPNSVTLFGESAGASSIAYLILSHAAKGLFHRAIIHSGSSNSPHTFDRHPIETAVKVAKRLGYNTRDTKELLEIFQNSTANDIVKASYVDATNDALAPNIIMPCVEDPGVSKNAVITKSPKELRDSVNEVSNISVIMGYNDKEGIMWAANYNSRGLENLDSNFKPAIPRSFTFNSEEDKASFIKAVRSFYFNNCSTDYNGLIDYYSDALIMYPEVVTMEAFLRNPKVKVYCFYFKYDSIRNLVKLTTRLMFTPGASHADELFYVFDALVYQLIPKLPSDAGFINSMTTLWTNFAKTGNPSTKSISWVPSEDKLRILKLDKTIEMIDLPNPERIQFWRTAQEKYGLQYP